MIHTELVPINVQTLGKPIGKGNEATVYKAIHPVTQSNIVVKEIHRNRLIFKTPFKTKPTPQGLRQQYVDLEDFFNRDGRSPVPRTEIITGENGAFQEWQDYIVGRHITRGDVVNGTRQREDLKALLVKNGEFIDKTGRSLTFFGREGILKGKLTNVLLTPEGEVKAVDLGVYSKNNLFEQIGLALTNAMLITRFGINLRGVEKTFFIPRPRR